MTIQNLSGIPLLDSNELLAAPVEHFVELLHDADSFDRNALERIDFSLLHRVMRLLTRRAEARELDAVYRDMRSLVPVDHEEELADWKHRWRALADVLDVRMSSLAERRDAEVLAMAHVDRILALIAHRPGLSQAAVADELELKAANLSRILGVLEEHELIERRSAGREKQLHLGALATEEIVDEMKRRHPTAGAERDSAPRCASYLWPRAA